MDWLFGNEAVLRGVASAGVLLFFVGLETLLPARGRLLPRAQRWFCNVGLGAINALLVRLAFPLIAVGAALEAEARGIGLFNNIGWPYAAAFAATLLALDLLVYAQHALMHRVRWLWRLHMIHHADSDVDATTGFRFHPLEIALSQVLKIAGVVALGAPVAAVIAFEILLNAAAIFNHANVALPARLDRVLRAIVVTPDMHRVHHSALGRERDCNYGFSISLWDRLFGTYRAQSAGGAAFPLGLDGVDGSRAASLPRLVAAPFAPHIVETVR